MKKIFLLAPDKGSGYAFEKKLKEENIYPILQFYKIPPRVLGDKINTSKHVTTSFEKAIEKSITFGLPIAIACNTLQFWLTKINKNLVRRGKIITTFKACRERFKDFKNKPVWLGTTPTAKLVKGFPTLYKLGLNDLQSKIQELIWRIKMINGDDVSSAPDLVKKDLKNKEVQKEKIFNLKKEIIFALKENKIKRAILGCTELPVVFKRSKVGGIKFYDPAAILAVYIKSSKL